MAETDITLENLRQLLHIQTELREQTESQWRQAQHILLGLLEAFAPDEVDRRLKSSQPLDSLPANDLGQILRQQISARLQQAQAVMKEPKSAHALSTQEQLKGCQAEVDRLRAENQRLSESVSLLANEKGSLQNQLAALQQVLADAGQRQSPASDNGNGRVHTQPSSLEEPDWMAVWRKADSFERDASVLTMISETGYSRRPLIEAQTAALLGIKKAGGSIRALLTRLEERQLIELFRPWETAGSASGGRLPDLIRLAERGKLAFWLLTGRQPAANEYDRLLERHVTPEHTLVNLQAADALSAAGYQVNLTPPEIRLPDGSLFRPDLLLSDENGSPLFVEVERDAGKNIEKRQAKWRNFYQASGGRLYIVCDNRSCMRNVRSELNYYLGNQPAIISMTNLADLQAGKRGEGDSLWLEARRKGAPMRIESRP